RRRGGGQAFARLANGAFLLINASHCRLARRARRLGDAEAVRHLPGWRTAPLYSSTPHAVVSRGGRGDSETRRRAGICQAGERRLSTHQRLTLSSRAEGAETQRRGGGQ